MSNQLLDRTIQILTDGIPGIEHDLAERYLEPAPWGAVVEMAPVGGRIGRVLHAGSEQLVGRPSEDRLRSDLGTVLAAGLTCPLAAGDVVLLDHSHGKRIEGGYYGRYLPTQEVRFYGACALTGGATKRINWRDSLLATINTHDFELPFAADGDVLPPSFWLDEHSYVSYFRVANNASTVRLFQVLPPSEVSLPSAPGKGQLDLDLGAMLTAPVEWRKAYRARVYDSGDLHLDVIGDDLLCSWRELGSFGNVRPLGNKVLIRRPDMTESVGGIRLVDGERFREPIAEVVRVGPEFGMARGTKVWDLRPGQKVVYQALTVRPLRWFGAQCRDLALIDGDGILCIVEDDEAAEDRRPAAAPESAPVEERIAA